MLPVHLAAKRGVGSNKIILRVLLLVMVVLLLSIGVLLFGAVVLLLGAVVLLLGAVVLLLGVRAAEDALLLVTRLGPV